MKFKRGDTVSHVTDQNTKFLIVATVQIHTDAGVETKYLARQFYTKDSPQWPGISVNPIELMEMELRKVK